MGRGYAYHTLVVITVVIPPGDYMGDPRRSYSTKIIGLAAPHNFRGVLAPVL